MQILRLRPRLFVPARPSLLQCAVSMVLASGAGVVLAQTTTDTQTRVQSDGKTLDEVTVTATRQNTTQWQAPASIQVVDGIAFERNVQVNLSEGLAAVPGLQVRNRQNYAQDVQLIMRGFGARSTFGVRGIRVYVDDVPATMPDGQSQTSHIDLFTLDRMEVLNGPLSGMYGNASGGVLLAYTQDGQGPASITTSAAAGSDGMRRWGLRVQGATDAQVGVQNYSLSTTRFDTDGYRQQAQAQKGLANAKLGIGLHDGSRLKIVLNHVDVQAQDPLGQTRAQMLQDRRQSPTAVQFDTRKTVRQSQVGLVWDKKLNADQQLHVMGYYGQRSNRQYQSIPSAAQINNAGHSGGVIDLNRDYGGAEARLTSALQVAGYDALLVTGLSYDALKDARSGYENFIRPANTSYGVKGAMRRDETNRVNSLDPYAQATVWLSPQWSVDGALRYSQVRFRSRDLYLSNGDDSGSTRYSAWLPSAAIRWQPTEAWSFYASAGRGFETPTANELAYRPRDAAGQQQLGLNLDLKPARSTSWELGSKWRVHPQGLVTAAVFQIDTKQDIVSAENNNGKGSFRNAAKTSRKGVELSYRQSWLEHAQLDFAYTYTRARYGQDAGAAWSGKRIPGVPQQSAYASVRWAPDTGWQAGADVQALSRIAVNDANAEFANGFATLGLSGGYAWKQGAWRWQWFARVDNAQDKDYVGSVIVNDGNSRFYEPAAGRQWSTGLTATWQF
ncbi:TonB-dependent receptor family protein [Lampropedia puyangensis]|nr:TonB-dependent receptor [Lampropedia puyangensis]